MKTDITKKCLLCKKDYKKHINISVDNFEKSKFCSRDCANKSRIGTSPSKETRKKLSDSLKGRIPKNLEMLHGLPRTKEWKEQQRQATLKQIKEKGAPHLEHTHTEATQEKMS